MQALHGYWYRTVSPADARDGRSESQFGFTAYPETYGITGTDTFFVNNLHTIFRKDLGGSPVLAWPSLEELVQTWTPVDR